MPVPNSGWDFQRSAERTSRTSFVVRFCDRRHRILVSTIIEEIIMKLDSKSGAPLAAAAATLFLAGATLSTVSTTAYAAGGKCMARNACKGQSACNGAN